MSQRLSPATTTCDDALLVDAALGVVEFTVAGVEALETVGAFVGGAVAVDVDAE
jgi:hypothetical protein